MSWSKNFPSTWLPLNEFPQTLISLIGGNPMRMIGQVACKVTLLIEPSLEAAGKAFSISFGDRLAVRKTMLIET